MNRAIWLTVIIGMAFLNSCDKLDKEEEERQLRELWTRASHYVCTGDWENYKLCWAQSSKTQLIHPDEGEWLKGWDKIGSKYEKMLKTGIRCSISHNDLTINVSPSADVAWGTVDITIDFQDTERTQIHLWETVVFEKIKGEWMIVHGMASIPKNLME